METPLWALTIAYWLHMLATVTWIGGLAALAMFVLPAAQRALAPPAYADLLAAIQRRFDPLAWFCLAVLVGTGMFQMSASPSYSGFLAVENTWALAILLKHLVFFGMAGLSAYLTWVLLPKARRLALLRSRQSEAAGEQIARLETQEVRLLQLNLILGVIVLALTAIARAA
jgi:uncharacterized membrane protein